MSLDELLVGLGGFGRFQVLILASTALNVLCISWSMLQMSYAGFVPDWYCADAEAGPGYRSNGTMPRSNSTLQACRVDTTNWTDDHRTMDCRTFDYDTTAVTVVMEWDLVCDRKWIKSALTSIQMGGVLLGAFLSGQLADWIGRKKTLYGFVLFHAAMNAVAAFSVSWQMFAVCRFFIGFGIGGVLVVNTAYPVEFLPIKWRPARSLIPTWSTGVCIFAVFALTLDNWSHLHLACAVSSLPGLTGYIYLPESLRWLSVQGRLKEAEEVCRKLAAINRTEMPAKAKSIIEKIYQEELATNANNASYNYLDIFRGWRILKVTLTFSFFWFSMSLIYYGISFGVSSLAGNLFLNIFLLSIVEVPALISTFFFMNKIGRKWTTFWFSMIGLLGATGCLLAHFFASGSLQDKLITGLSLITKMGIGAAWGAIATWGLELYPTVTRNLGYGFSNTAARVGGIVAPFLIDFDNNVVLSYAVIGMLNLLVVLLCSINPETKGRILEDTLGSRTGKADSKRDVVVDGSKPEMTSDNNSKMAANGHKTEVFTVAFDANAGSKELSSAAGVESVRL